MKILLQIVVITLFLSFSLSAKASDVGVTGFVSPVSGFDMSEIITITVENFGAEPVSDFLVGFTIDGGPAFTETFYGTLEPGESMDFTFSIAVVDLDALGVHTICAFTMYEGDTDGANDWYCGDVISLRIPFYDLEGETIFCDSVILDAGSPGLIYTWNTAESTQTITALTSGTYTVTISDGSSFELTESIDIAIIESPIASFTYEVDSSLVYFNSTSSGTELLYSWDIDGIYFSDYENATYNFLASGMYTITLQTSNYCGVSSISETVNLDITTVNDIQPSINIFPNPSFNEIIITMNSNEEYAYQLVNLENIILKKGNLNAYNSIDVFTLPSGIYMLQLLNVKSGIQRIYSTPVIIQH